ncbi:nickel import ATP-binding protein NikO [Clostridium tepidiprofundi DSM 19306]|uniref:Nickel import ATP-binding protein NikO n=1 Tax=Clostridium tepidiprofundi DSM 19306 TaxID=1121338 RepID=A0A151B2W9_9CLOT|nr:ABC transporter ATP-binding protein [Clostridium tepidiprofundi]KYH34258.1 nickel import ATP-binding protein NikO [Clostridium tepidiprofundi DSM 19306]
MIDITNVEYSYNNNIALTNINLHIDKGESIALLGPNGSGKSTLLKLINGILFPNKGEYKFEGTNITKKQLSNIKFSKLFHKKIGFIFQNSETQLFCANVYDEIAFGPRQMGMNETQVEKRVNDCLDLLEINELKYRQPYNLSGGEKKKVAIACVLSLNPDVITLDEPMNSLDPKTKRFLKNLIIKLNESGKTIICSTHDFEYVDGIFKRAIVFSNEHTIVRDDVYKNVLNDDNFLYEHNIK